MLRACRVLAIESRNRLGIFKAGLSSTSFLNGTNAAYIDIMLEKWREDPLSVHSSWHAYFKTGQFASPGSVEKGRADLEALSKAPPVKAGIVKGTNSTVELKVAALLRAYQVKGHLLADLDPLQISHHGLDRRLINKEDLSLENFGLTRADLQKSVDISVPGILGFQDATRGAINLGKLVERLHDVYSTHIGAEYMHISNTEQCNWLREQLETATAEGFSRDESFRILDRLTWADHFERYLAQKWSTTKRFGVEGAEALIPGMKEIIDTAACTGCREIVIGMPHRGRLNVLANVLRKPLDQIFCEFSGGSDTSDIEGSGDVKYHLGMSFDRPVYGGGNIHLTLVANPSHLEAVNPVVVGKARAKQYYAHDKDHRRVIPILLHGDAAFAGQGVVYETMGLGNLPSFTVGGTIHIIVNNQIGFTTNAIQSCSSNYCSDLAKAFDAPVFHVNGDDIEAVIRVCRIAANWRQRFGKDVVIDIVCYRKYGHNEIDEPSFTQPHMYAAIAKKKSPLDLYTQQLVDKNIMTQSDIDNISKETFSILDQQYEKAQKSCAVQADWLSSNWRGLTGAGSHSMRQLTGVEQSVLLNIGSTLCSVPKSFNVHRRLMNILKNKAAMFEAKQGFDWGTAEALAIGSLLLESVHVRLSGQDVERGTFSHRHSVLHDQKDVHAEPLVPLNKLSDKQAEFSVSNSSLSEYGVLGFELGYSLENPNSLVIFEAQFGDFLNTAQVIIDQFICSGESKWMRQNGLVLLLPHGYEGQGPEHSSGRLERFLQMSNDPEHLIPVMENGKRKQIQQTNWQVIMPTTPASYFHALRRQVHRNFRKPLVVFNPKSLLRHKSATSSLDEMSGDTRFQRIIGEQNTEIVSQPEQVKRVVFSAGKIYYDLIQHRENINCTNVALIRIEQISPFPFDKVLEQMQIYSQATDILWAQEEPRNMGAWTYVRPRIETALQEIAHGQPKTTMFAGRAAAASPSTGFVAVHKRELEEILAEVFSV